MHDQAIDAAGEQLCELTKRVMIVSPLPDRVKQLFITLSSACFDVFSLHEFNESILTSVKPELVIYDALPTIAAPSCTESVRNGQPLLAKVSSYNVPLVILMDEAAYDQKDQLELAGAEVVVWPSEVEGVLGRIQQLLEKQLPFSALDHLLIFKDIAVDTKKMIVKKNDEQIDLTKTEYDLLLHFLTSNGAVQSREQLLDKIWGSQFYAGSNVVDVHIKSLRKKLNDNAVDPSYVVTVRGAGYRLADGR